MPGFPVAPGAAQLSERDAKLSGCSREELSLGKLRALGQVLFSDTWRLRKSLRAGPTLPKLESLGMFVPVHGSAAPRAARPREQGASRIYPSVCHGPPASPSSTGCQELSVTQVLRKAAFPSTRGCFPITTTPLTAWGPQTQLCTSPCDVPALAKAPSPPATPNPPHSWLWPSCPPILVSGAALGSSCLPCPAAAAPSPALAGEVLICAATGCWKALPEPATCFMMSIAVQS